MYLGEVQHFAGCCRRGTSVDGCVQSASSPLRTPSTEGVASDPPEVWPTWDPAEAMCPLSVHGYFTFRCPQSPRVSSSSDQIWLTAPRVLSNSDVGRCQPPNLAELGQIWSTSVDMFGGHRSKFGQPDERSPELIDLGRSRPSIREIWRPTVAKSVRNRPHFGRYRSILGRFRDDSGPCWSMARLQPCGARFRGNSARSRASLADTFRELARPSFPSAN